ncbi:MAG: type VI secretion system baseplate subunit TssG [Holosporales bacterium]|jgi:type VI secretion system ImpH/TssG family protein|nr:type VI secretion system baseplate subunit TssG [Holosporales bacterium]
MGGSGTTLYDGLVSSAEKFAFVKAMDVATAVCGTEHVCIKANVNFVSKFADVSTVDGLSERVAEVCTNLYGIAGIEGILPDCYVQEFWQHNGTFKRAITDFLDIFNSKFLELRYLFMKRHHIQSLSCPSEESTIGRTVSSLTGFESGDNDKCTILAIPFQLRIAGQNLFWQRTRTCEGMRVLLTSFFEVPIKVRQFVGTFIEIDKSQQSAIGVLHNRHNALSENCFLGSNVWDQTSAVDIEIGPLDFRTYVKFLPKQSLRDQQFAPLEKMKEIIRMYVSYGTSVRLHFYLEEESRGSYELPLIGTRRLHKDSFLCGAGGKMAACFTENVYIHSRIKNC